MTTQLPECLIIHPDRFEDVAQKITNALINTGLLAAGGSDYDRSIGVILKSLLYQHHLHKTWSEEDESSATDFRADRPDNLPRDGSTAI